MAERITCDGVMEARIDRLPLTRVQWQRAALVEVTWGFIIFDTDGIGARLYAFGPDHLGWILWIVIPGALLPAVLIRFGGIRQARAVLEQIST